MNTSRFFLCRCKLCVWTALGPQTGTRTCTETCGGQKPSGGVTWSHTSFIYSLCFASADFSETLLSCCFFVFSQNFSYFKVLTLFIKYQNFLSFVFFWICARSRCLCWQQLDARCWGCRDKRRQRGGRLTFWAGRDADRRGAERWVTLAALDAFLRFLRTHLNFFFFCIVLFAPAGIKSVKLGRIRSSAAQTWSTGRFSAEFKALWFRLCEKLAVSQTRCVFPPVQQPVWAFPLSRLYKSSRSESLKPSKRSSASVCKDILNFSKFSLFG